MHTYNFQSLQSDLQGFLATIERISATYHLAFSVQFFTGCRFNELRQISRFSIIDSTQYTLQPQKGNNVRILPLNLLPPDFVAMIQTQSDYFEGLTQSTASYYFRSFYYNKRIFHDNKQLTTNLFRHNYCKYLHNAGYSILQIAFDLGERDQKNAENYIFSDLYYTSRDDNQLISCQFGKSTGKKGVNCGSL